jgi:hypothetical protein
MVKKAMMTLPPYRRQSTAARRQDERSHGPVIVMNYYFMTMR